MRLLLQSLDAKAAARKILRITAFVVVVALVIETTLAILFYRAAEDHIHRNDPRQLQNRSEVRFWYAPLKLTVGDVLRRTELEAYLHELGYEDRGDTPGTFSLSGSTLNVIPRSQVFHRLSLSFETNRLTRIMADGRLVHTAEIEPLPMETFVHFLADESMKEQRVRRIIIPAERVPSLIGESAISIEDHRFFEHHGIDALGIVNRVASGKGGGSSITQQLVKNTLFKGASDEFWQRYLPFLPSAFQRKSADVFLALAAEKRMSKSEILAAYLSIVPLGAVDGIEIHGVAAGAREFFGKNVTDLTLAEAACLSGMFNRPSEYLSAARQGDYTKLIARRNAVLDAMRRYYPHSYSADTIANAKTEPVRFVFASSLSSNRPSQAYSRDFAHVAARNLSPELASRQKGEGSLEVFTTLDFRLQKEAVRIAEKAAKELKRRVTRSCRSQQRMLDCASVNPQVSLLAMDPQSGAVVALIGNVTANRSPGSIFKALVYLRAVEAGTYNNEPFTAATIIDPLRDSLSGYRPDQNTGSRTSARIGLARSFNFHAVAAAESAGLRETIEYVGRLTQSHPEISGMSAIGGTAGSETSLLQLVQAYSVFANHGRIASASFEQGFSHNGVRHEISRQRSRPAAGADATFVVTQMLRSVIGPSGTSPRFLSQAGLKSNSRVAGKSGTGMVADVWFIAITPRLVVGVWAGLPNNEIPLRMSDGFTGATVAAPIAAQFIRAVRQYQPGLLEGDFQQPAGVVVYPVDPEKGCLRRHSQTTEFFIRERVPRTCAASR